MDGQSLFQHSISLPPWKSDTPPSGHLAVAVIAPYRVQVAGNELYLEAWSWLGRTSLEIQVTPLSHATSTIASKEGCTISMHGGHVRNHLVEKYLQAEQQSTLQWSVCGEGVQWDDAEAQNIEWIKTVQKLRDCAAEQGLSKGHHHCFLVNSSSRQAQCVHPQVWSLVIARGRSLPSADWLAEQQMQLSLFVLAWRSINLRAPSLVPSLKTVFQS